jgi:hypothetical protein
MNGLKIQKGGFDSRRVIGMVAAVFIRWTCWEQLFRLGPREEEGKDERWVNQTLGQPDIKRLNQLLFGPLTALFWNQNITDTLSGYQGRERRDRNNLSRRPRRGGFVRSVISRTTVR